MILLKDGKIAKEKEGLHLAKKLICPHCHAKLQAESVVCPSCGRTLQERKLMRIISASQRSRH
jgi:predicted amidophosphoribosyltransferase